MQTFLPYADFEATARVLDELRLGKQRVEVLQILRALLRPAYGWKHHPAVLMWKGYEPALASYGAAICEEWVRRGRADTCAAKIEEELRDGLGETLDVTLPPWLGDERVHESHRANLLRKDPEWYGARFSGDPELPYFWPVRKVKA